MHRIYRLPSILAALMLGVFLALPMVARAAVTLDSEEQAFVTLINNYRQQNGLVPLKLSPKLQNSANWLATDMAAKNYFNHTDSLGRVFNVRLQAFGYTYPTSMGENIAAGNATASATFTQWKNSPGHNANMLTAGYVVMGIARAYNAGSTYGWYWVNDFGGYDDSGASTADTTPPTVSIASPASGATVSGTVLVHVDATDNVGVRHVVFQVDTGTKMGVWAAPYNLNLDTTALTNGQHTVSATADDAAGNSTTKMVTLNVNNLAPDTASTRVLIPTTVKAVKR